MQVKRRPNLKANFYNVHRLLTAHNRGSYATFEDYPAELVNATRERILSIAASADKWVQGAQSASAIIDITLHITLYEIEHRKMKLDGANSDIEPFVHGCLEMFKALHSCQHFIKHGVSADDLEFNNNSNDDDDEE